MYVDDNRLNIMLITSINELNYNELAVYFYVDKLLIFF